MMEDAHRSRKTPTGSPYPSRLSRDTSIDRPRGSSTQYSLTPNLSINLRLRPRSFQAVDGESTSKAASGGTRMYSKGSRRAGVPGPKDTASGWTASASDHTITSGGGNAAPPGGRTGQSSATY